MRQRSEQAMLDKLVWWAEWQKPVRLMLLTSTRANNSLPRDALSDYDVELVVTDLAPYVVSTDWVRHFGDPIVSILNEKLPAGNLPHFISMVQYADGSRIDFQVYPVALFQRFKEEPTLPDGWDIGYRVLLDKDGLSQGLAPYTGRAHIPAKPNEETYLALVNEFWWESTYVAKYLWRDELMFARTILDANMRYDYLRRMLEWYAETLSTELDHNWTIRLGLFGKGFKKLLPPEIWRELAATFVGGPQSEENWQALFRTTALFRKIAASVGERLGYAYPLDLDERVSTYLRKVQRLDKDAEEFA